MQDIVAAAWAAVGLAVPVAGRNRVAVVSSPSTLHRLSRKESHLMSTNPKDLKAKDASDELIAKSSIDRSVRAR